MLSSLDGFFPFLSALICSFDLADQGFLSYERAYLLSSTKGGKRDFAQASKLCL